MIHPATICPVFCVLAAAAQTDTRDPLLPHPHPLITEILYAVPTGEAGDANADGQRHVSGDEFIELFNPHDRPIQLRGYQLCDRNSLQSESTGPFIFTFPAFELPPGEFVIVFNGHEQRWRGPIGDQTRAPASRSEFFHDAWIFTADPRSSRVALANADELVLLRDPSGAPVHAIAWGNPAPPPPSDSRLIESTRAVAQSSVQRPDPRSPLAKHADLDGLPFSPGGWPEKPPETPPESPPETTPPMAWITKNSAGMKIDRRSEPYLTDAMRRELAETILPRYETKLAALLPALRMIQHEYHWIPYQAMEEIAAALDINPAEVLDTASFYEEFWLRPRGRNLIAVCRSIACEVCNHRAVTDAVRDHLGIEVGDTTDDGEFTLVEIECIGACGGAPAALVNETLVEPASRDAIIAAIENARHASH